MPIGDHHLAVLAERSFERTGPDHEGLLFEGRWYRAGELFDRVTRVAGGLAAAGVQPGDRVVVVMANTPDVGVLYQACWRAGAVATPVLFLLPPPELRHILEDSDARVVVTTPEFVANVQQAAAGLPVTVVVDGEVPDTLPLAELAASDPLPIVGRADDDLAALLYTGGTTGRSKGVELTHENLWHAGHAGYASTADDPLDRTIVPLPLSHSFGLLVSVTSQHQPDPGVAVLQRWFDPAAFVQLVEEHRIEQATVVPTMLKVLLDQPLEDHDLSSLQRVVCGSAPLPVPILEAFERRVPSAVVCEGYGLTETAAATSVNRRHDRRIGTVGQPLPGVEVKVVDPHGEPLPLGTPGEIHIKARANARGYRGDAEATASTFLDGGWVATGDVGTIDEDGFITILDRTKDLIIRNGFNIYPRDVEEALLEHPAIVGAAVIGRADDEVGEEVAAAVQVAPGSEAPAADDLRAWARERIGPKAYPRHIKIVDAIPLTPVMKIDRKAVRELW